MLEGKRSPPEVHSWLWGVRDAPGMSRGPRATPKPTAAPGMSHPLPRVSQPRAGHRTVAGRGAFPCLLLPSVLQSPQPQLAPSSQAPLCSLFPNYFPNPSKLLVPVALPPR